ncbi:hypothetical protein BJ170DRAFT_628845 [Xylariales sp. AK1849]|nr:hypothetical protein BJ170DRAFT_628845 [Xylariales sp. AK1849]
MYKNKLKRWKLFKNNRAADVAAVLKQQCQRTAVGKETLVVRNGKRIDTRSYLKRKGVSADDLVQLARSGELPDHLRCITPPPSDLLRSPGALGVKEVVGEWLFREGQRCDADTIRPLRNYHDSRAHKVSTMYYDAIWLMWKDHSLQGWEVAHNTFDQLHVVLDDHLLYPVLNLLMIVIILPDAQIHKTLWSYLASFALIRFGAAHMSYHMLSQLAKLFSQEDTDDRNGLLFSMITDFVDNIPYEPHYYDMLSLCSAEMLRSHRKHRYALSTLLDQSTMTRKAAQGQGYDSHLHVVRSFLLLDLGWESDWQDDEVYLECIELLNAKESSGSQPDQAEVNCLTAMALYHRALCDGATATASESQQNHQTARYLMQEAIALDWVLSGATIYNFEGLLLLQEWCEEAEDWALLEIVRRRNDECLRELFVEWGVSR